MTAPPAPVAAPPAPAARSQSDFVKNEWTDELICAILRSEWAARQAAG